MPTWLFWTLLTLCAIAAIIAFIGWLAEDDVPMAIGATIFIIAGTILYFNPRPAHADFWPTPTTVKDSGKVYVNAHVGTARISALHNSVSRIDTYTNTHMVYGACHKNTRCITIKIGNVPGPETGRSSGSYNRTVITVQSNVAKKYLPYLFTHELGHAFTLGHTKSCVSVMSKYLTCHGRPTTTHLTAAQRTHLGKH
jgi:hypothetical protein